MFLPQRLFYTIVVLSMLFSYVFFSENKGNLFSRNHLKRICFNEDASISIRISIRVVPFCSPINKNMPKYC